MASSKRQWPGRPRCTDGSTDSKWQFGGHVFGLRSPWALHNEWPLEAFTALAPYSNFSAKVLPGAQQMPDGKIWQIRTTLPRTNWNSWKSPRSSSPGLSQLVVARREAWLVWSLERACLLEVMKGKTACEFFFNLAKRGWFDLVWTIENCSQQRLSGATQPLSSLGNAGTMDTGTCHLAIKNRHLYHCKRFRNDRLNKLLW